jgi:hypothetical protein
MKVRIFSAVVVILLLPNLLLADQPPSWEDFEIKSSNGRYLAEVKALEGQDRIERHKRKYRLRVYDVSGAAKKELWASEYAYDGYPEGMLSDDGSTFVYVSFWFYAKHPVVSIYRMDTVKLIQAKEFGIDEAKLRKSASHLIWLNDDPYIKEFTLTESNNLGLKIHTVDNKIRIIDVESGTILK